jgi:uncharacterized LabA/DUF88 family protein
MDTLKMSPAEPEVKTVTVYVDGFNLYHSINSLRKDHLKWLNVRQLATTFLAPGESLWSVYFFTALTYGSPEKRARHIALNAALRSYGVKVIESPFVPRKRWCDHKKTEGGYCKFHEEKQSDVALAVRMIADAQSGATDRIVILTADTDQIPAIQYLRNTYPNIPVVLAIPPARKEAAWAITSYCSGHIEVEEGRLFANLMPPIVSNVGFSDIARPIEYRPPSGN